MASFRPLGQFNQYFLDDGSVNAGGSITFYETDLTTLKDTFSDPDLTVPNSNPVLLDADGRLSTDVWGSGVYGAVLKDSLGTIIETRNNIQSGADPGLVIPALIANAFLTNDGSNLLWSLISQVPDPTGSNGNWLTTDGSNFIWAPLPTPTLPTIVITATSIKINNLLIQWGTGVMPAPGTSSASVTVNFGTAFSAPPYFVGLTQTQGPGATSKGGMLILGASSQSASSFTANGDINLFTTGAYITRTTNFQWYAVGPVAA